MILSREALTVYTKSTMIHYARTLGVDYIVWEILVLRLIRTSTTKEPRGGI